MSTQTQNHTHILFTSAPKHSSLSHTLRINMSRALPQHEAHKSAMHDCAWELLLLENAGPPYRCISLHKSRLSEAGL